MKRFVIPIIIILRLLNVSCFAAEVTLLDAGQPAPYAGFLFTRIKADEFRLLDINYKLSVTTNEILTKQNVLLNEQLDKANANVTRLADQVVKERNDLWSNIGMFLLGAAATTLVAFGVSRATK